MITYKTKGLLSMIERAQGLTPAKLTFHNTGGKQGALLGGSKHHVYQNKMCFRLPKASFMCIKGMENWTLGQGKKVIKRDLMLS